MFSGVLGKTTVCNVDKVKNKVIWAKVAAARCKGERRLGERTKKSRDKPNSDRQRHSWPSWRRHRV